MEGLAHKYKTADGKSAHKVYSEIILTFVYSKNGFVIFTAMSLFDQVMRRYREGLSKLDKSSSVARPACATSFHDGHICHAPKDTYDMIYGS